MLSSRLVHLFCDERVWDGSLQLCLCPTVHPPQLQGDLAQDGQRRGGQASGDRVRGARRLAQAHRLLDDYGKEVFCFYWGNCFF